MVNFGCCISVVFISSLWLSLCDLHFCKWVATPHGVKSPFPPFFGIVNFKHGDCRLGLPSLKASAVRSSGTLVPWISILRSQCTAHQGCKCDTCRSWRQRRVTALTDGSDMWQCLIHMLSGHERLISPHTSLPSISKAALQCVWSFCLPRHLQLS